MRLADRRILVAGAAPGIGGATAALFRAEGAAVALLDRNEALLHEAVHEIGLGDGPPAVAAHAELIGDVRTATAVAEATRASRGLDGLVGAAGIDLLRPFPEMTLAEWRRIIDINLIGAFSVSLAAAPHLRAAGSGTIVHIASGAALRPLEARTAYCASKAGLVIQDARGRPRALQRARQRHLSRDH